MSATKMSEKADSQECQLPCSNGQHEDVDSNKLNEWCDLEVLSAGDFKFPKGMRETREKEVEDHFYKGQEADWLNFYFEDQILRRDIHQGFSKRVADALRKTRTNTRHRVTTVSLLHQPGAGGTTAARQVLWDLREEYRCCVVRNITDATADQLDDLRAFKDDAPKPIVVLIDNLAKDRYTELIEKLKEKSTKQFRDKSVYCKIILCLRRNILRTNWKSDHFHLPRSLTKLELAWFQGKSAVLTTRFETDPESSVNPKVLSSFNMMKENFNKTHILQLVEEVTSELEVAVLQIVSFLNCYDLDFNQIRASCIEKLLNWGGDNDRERPHSDQLHMNTGWDGQLSLAMKGLLRMKSDKKSGCLIRVIDKVFAQEIWQTLKKREETKKESEMMFKLFNSLEFHHHTTENEEHLKTIIINVMKKRSYDAEGKKEKFSQLVFYLASNESPEVALELFEKLFEITKDPFIAQQTARFCIEKKNWERAEYYAQVSTNLRPKNSFFWDTYGQVFKYKLRDYNLSTGKEIWDVHSLIELSEKCIACFRKSQQNGEDEPTRRGKSNLAGYFNELKSIDFIFKALKRFPVFHDAETLHRYLVDHDYHLDDFKDHESEFLKSLDKFAYEAMRRLDDEYLQVNSSNNSSNNPAHKFEAGESDLNILRSKLECFFGECTDDSPGESSRSDQCRYRYRRARTLGATSLRQLLQKKQETSILEKIYELLLKNLESRAHFVDVKAVLDTATVRSLCKPSPLDLDYARILEWCRSIYSMNIANKTCRFYLEVYLYYVLYNFPTKERREFELCTPAELSTAVAEWKNAFQHNYPRFTRDEGIKKRETTIFFLGNGTPLQDIVHRDTLEAMSGDSLEEKWRQPSMFTKELRLHTGTLMPDGEQVKLTISDTKGKRSDMLIPTSLKEIDIQNSRKRVNFYIGFSFSGPKAFGMF